MATDRTRPSCYLLEFSVSPGGARLGEVHAHGNLDGLRKLVTQRDDPQGLDPYLVMWYGAVLHLWVVRSGEIVDGIDLHPHLRTGTPQYDGTLARFLSLRRGDDEGLWSDARRLVSLYDFDSLNALPLLTRLFELFDRAVTTDPDAVAELKQLRDQIKTGDLPGLDAPAADYLGLDWEAVATVVPPLEEPLLSAGGVTVTWAPHAVQHPDSYLADSGFIPVTLYAGLNDLENGDDEFLYLEDEEAEEE